MPCLRHRCCRNTQGPAKQAPLPRTTNDAAQLAPMQSALRDQARGLQLLPCTALPCTPTMEQQLTARGQLIRLRPSAEHCVGWTMQHLVNPWGGGISFCWPVVRPCGAGDRQLTGSSTNHQAGLHRGALRRKPRGGSMGSRPSPGAQSSTAGCLQRLITSQRLRPCPQS